MHRIAVRAASPDDGVLTRAAGVLKGGGLIVIPTDTLYGLAADPFNAAAVAAVFRVKGRPDGRALPLIAADVPQVEQQLGRLAPPARRLADAFWPGPLTLIVPAPATLATGVASVDGTVGVRVPAHEVARMLCRRFGGVLTATSANVTGEPAVMDPELVSPALAAMVDMLLDAGPTPGGPPSTLVDVTAVPPRLVRAGAVSWEDVQQCLRA